MVSAIFILLNPFMRSVIKSCILNVRTNDRYGLGTCYLRASKIRRAEYHFRKAMEIHPNNAVVLGCVAMVSADIVIWMLASEIMLTGPGTNPTFLFTDTGTAQAAGYSVELLQ